MIHSKRLFGCALLMGLLIQCGWAIAAADSESKWNSVLRNRYFGQQKIVESDKVIELTAPYRAEDPALVPISVISKMEQGSARYIERIVLLVDKNPEPFVGDFQFSPESGKADLAMRVRINTYSNVRAIARLNTGELHMHKVFVKATGGCSAPVGADLEEAMKRIGRMKFRVDRDFSIDRPVLAQLLISHPNLTGMQMDQVTRRIKPAHFIETMKVTFNDQPVFSAKTDIAISADPNFRFYFMPQRNGTLKAEVNDNKGMSWVSTYEVSP
jgi:sulfur-oxidizing protein SoxY